MPVFPQPDLGGLTCINSSTWLEHLTLRSMAIQHSYADFNGDVLASRRPCPPNAALLYGMNGTTNCKLDPIVVVSAFANAGMQLPTVTNQWPCIGLACYNPLTQNVCSGSGSTLSCYFAGQTVANEHLTFPPLYGGWNNTQWYNGQALSYHSYGKSGHQLQLSTTAMWQGTQLYHDESGVTASTISTNLVNMPVLLTEHQSHTNGNWNSLASNCDSTFEASRLANQILSQAILGYESYIFKARLVRCIAALASLLTYRLLHASVFRHSLHHRRHHQERPPLG